MQLSAHFSLAEMTVSATGARLGLDNTPPPAVLAVLRRTAERMEAVRAILGDKPILVTSGYRSPAVNRAVRGSATSAHMSGHAVDFICPRFGSPKAVAERLAIELTDFDQLILEFGEWVHLGFGPGQRAQLRTARRVSGRTQYLPGIV